MVVLRGAFCQPAERGIGLEAKVTTCPYGMVRMSFDARHRALLDSSQRIAGVPWRNALVLVDPNLPGRLCETSACPLSLIDRAER